MLLSRSRLLSGGMFSGGGGNAGNAAEDCFEDNEELVVEEEEEEEENILKTFLGVTGEAQGKARREVEVEVKVMRETSKQQALR